MSEHDMDVACQAAETFVPAFYGTINDQHSLAPFYISACSKYTSPPSVTVNGHVCEDVSSFETALKTQANGLSRRVVHDIQSFDAQVLNPRYINCAPEWVVQQHTTTAPSGPSRDRVDALSILVQVTGLVRYGHPTDREAPPPRNFSEHLVLVPNWDAIGRGPKASSGLKGARRWLIQSQIFRAL